MRASTGTKKFSPSICSPGVEHERDGVGARPGDLGGEISERFAHSPLLEVRLGDHFEAGAGEKIADRVRLVGGIGPRLHRLAGGIADHERDPVLPADAARHGRRASVLGMQNRCSATRRRQARRAPRADGATRPDLRGHRAHAPCLPGGRGAVRGGSGSPHGLSLHLQTSFPFSILQFFLAGTTGFGGGATRATGGGMRCTTGGGGGLAV